MLNRLKQYHNNTNLGVIDQMVVSGGNFLTGLLLARWLGLEQFGVFTLLWMVILFALSLNMAFITKPLLTLIAKQSDVSEYFGSLHTIQLILALAGGALTLLLGSLSIQMGILNLSVQLILCTAFLVVTQLIYDYYRKYFYARRQIISSLVLDMVIYGLQIIGMFFLYSSGWLTLQTVLWLLATVQGLTLVSCLPFIERPGIHISALSSTVQSHLHFSGWMSLTALMQWFTANYFIIAAGGILGTAMVGLIRIVQQLIGLIHILFLAMENLLPTTAAKLLQTTGSTGLIKYLKQQLLRWSLPFAASGILFLVAGPWVIRTFFKTDLNGNYILMIGYLGLYILVFISIPIRIYFRTIEHTRPMFLAYLAGTLFSFFAASLLLNQFGIAGFVAGLCFMQMIMITIYTAEYQTIKNKPPIYHSFNKTI